MTNPLPDWNDLRDILLIAAAGSLSAAARHAGVSQSTMSRRLAAIEAGGQPVFLRDETGRLTPNERGQVFVQAARDMSAAYDRMRLAFSDTPEPLRIAACAIGAKLFIEDALPEWNARADIPSELVVLDDLLSADPRSYDVLVTIMGSVPEHSAGVSIGRVEWGLYATPAYRRDNVWTGGLDGHRVLRAAGSLATVDAYRWLARQPGTVAMLSASPATMAQMAAKNIGIALLPRAIGDAHDALVLVEANPCPPSEVWMIADAKEAVKPAISGLFKWARGRFRPPAIRKSA